MARRARKLTGADRVFLQALAAVIRARREKLNLSQRDLGAEIKTTQVAVCRMESGKVDFNVHRLRQIARALGTTPAKMIERAERVAGLV